MPHVDEGEMHALLDGAFAHDAPAAARIREEIATCAECHARFDEAQALRMRANAVLERALPRPATPPFESVVDRAGTVDAPRPFRFPAGAPLAWAATVVLALGLGWFGRDWLANPEGRFAERAADSRLSTTPTDSLSVPAEPVATPAPAAPPPPARREQAEVRRERLADATGAAAPSWNQAGARQDAAVAKATTGRIANAPENAAFARDSATGRSAEQLKRAAAPPPAAALSLAERVAATAALDQDESTRWQYGTLAEAVRVAGRPVLFVRSLPVENVGIARIDGRYVTRVVQRLPDGNLLEIVQELPLQTDSARAREETRLLMAPQAGQAVSKDDLGATVLRLMRVGWVLTGRATLSQDSLRALLTSAR